MTVDVQLDWSVRHVQWRHCFFFTGVMLKLHFPSSVTWPGPLGSLVQANSHWYVTTGKPPVVFLTQQYPYESDNTGKRTCLGTGFLMAKWNLPCCYRLFFTCFGSIKFVFVCKVVPSLLKPLVPCCHRMVSPSCEVTKELLQRSIQQGLQKDWKV